MSQTVPQTDYELARRAARLAAVQALYQMEQSGTGVKAVIREYRDYPGHEDEDGRAVRDADFPLFEDIVTGVVDIQDRLDKLIDRHLAEGWSLKRLDATARAILRCGAFELARRADIPVRTIINEYLECAHAFFDDEAREPGFINAVLDAAAKETRQDELNGGA